jgi:hypothetical protein
VQLAVGGRLSRVAVMHIPHGVPYLLIMALKEGADSLELGNFLFAVFGEGEQSGLG